MEMSVKESVPNVFYSIYEEKSDSLNNGVKENINPDNEKAELGHSVAEKLIEIEDRTLKTSSALQVSPHVLNLILGECCKQYFLTEGRTR